MLKREPGFTLIELMVVVLIISILVAVAYPVYSLSRDTAWKNTCKANLRIIDGAIQIYRAQNGEYPNPSVKSWSVKTGFSGTLVDPDDDADDLVPYYIKEPVYCPKGGVYTYNQDDSLTNRFTVCSIPDHN